MVELCSSFARFSREVSTSDLSLPSPDECIDRFQCHSQIFSSGILGHK